MAARCVVGQLVFSVHRAGQLPDGEAPSGHDDFRTAYPLTVAGSLVSTILPGALGHLDWGAPFSSHRGTVGCSAYLSITSGPPGLFARALIGS